MSQENVEKTRRIMEATGRREYQAVLPELDPDLNIDDTDIPEGTATDSFLQWLARWDAAWEDWRIEDLTVRAADDDRVIALFKMVVKGKGSGVELSRLDAVVMSFRAGKVVETGYYNDQAQALKTVGLEE
jgi:ketosteroid isomerase-like protein